MSDRLGSELYHGEKEMPWRDEELMRELYVEQKMSANSIRELFDCSLATVLDWVERHGFEKRSIKEAVRLKHGNYANMTTNPHGYEQWRGDEHVMLVHRLVAIAKFGFDETGGRDVHHKNSIPWDNRPENIELVDNEEHQRLHRKVDGLDRIRLAEFYEHGDISSRNLGDMFDVACTTVLSIHDEFYGGEA